MKILKEYFIKNRYSNFTEIDEYLLKHNLNNYCSKAVPRGRSNKHNIILK